MSHSRPLSLLLVYDEHEHLGVPRLKKAQVQDVQRALEARGHRATIASIDDFSMRYGIPYYRNHPLDTASFDGLWLRCGDRLDLRHSYLLAHRPDHQPVLKALAAAIPSFTDLQMQLAADRKAEMQQVLLDAGVPTPESLILKAGQGDLPTALAGFAARIGEESGCIVKRSEGYGGFGNRVFPSLAKARSHIEKQLRAGEDVVVQALVPAVGLERRVEVMVPAKGEPEVVFAFSSAGGFVGDREHPLALDAADQQRLQKLAPNAPLLQPEDKALAMQAAQAFGPGFYGVDIMGQPPRVLEVNPFSAARQCATLPMRLYKTGDQGRYLGVDYPDRMAGALVAHFSALPQTQHARDTASAAPRTSGRH